MPKPNFFVIGMARAGTTSLWHYLGKHPDVFMSPYKEPNYFDKDINFFDPNVNVKEEMRKLGLLKYNLKRERRYRLYVNYISLFKKAHNQKIIGECSVCYLTSQTACEGIYRFNKDAKILVSLRNPAEAIFSKYHLYKNMGIYPDTFANFVRSETLIDKYRLIPFYISKFRAFFGTQNVEIIFFEDLTRGTEKTYQQVLDFLEIDRNICPVFKKHESSQRIKKYAVVHILFDNVILKKVRETFSPNELGISKNINQLLGGYEQRPVMEDKTRHWLTMQFKTSVEQLEQMTDRNLSHWYN